MSAAWCGMCAIGPVSAGELHEHYVKVHAPRGELSAPRPHGSRRETRPAPKKRRPKPGVFAACEGCGLPLLEDEIRLCKHCA